MDTRFQGPNLVERIRRVRDYLFRDEFQVDVPDPTRHYRVRLSPYRARRQQVEGVVVNFIDVTSLLVPIDAS